MFEFSSMTKESFEKHSNRLFSILFENMSRIAPTGNPYEEDYRFWLQAMKEELEKGNRRIILCVQKESQAIVGYFQYSIQKNMLLLEEIQIKEVYQRKDSIFRGFFRFALDNIDESVDFVSAYANKQNVKSIGILRKLGLTIEGENKSGTSYLFRGTYSDLLNWYRGN